jgi:hypothetical protein
MRHFLKAFIGFLIGFVLYEAINYAPGGSFDLVSEAIRVVAIAAIAAAPLALFERRRGSTTERSEKTTDRSEQKGHAEWTPPAGLMPLQPSRTLAMVNEG